MNEKIRGCAAPRLEDLPRPCRELREPVVRVRLRTITPIYGGGVRTRQVDAVDVIRVPGVRGQLRWWWRALFAGEYHSAKELLAAERKRWGGIGERDEARRAAIVVEVNVQRQTAQLDRRPLSNAGPGYALWPARGANGEADAQRYEPNVELELLAYLIDDGLDPAEGGKVRAELRDCVRAWILFGGYGGRTRRGLGSLTVVSDVDSWLPKAATPEAINRLFARNVFAPSQVSADPQVPRLNGAELRVVGPAGDAHTAWTVAVDRLREFRQGVESGARRRGHPEGWEPRRPGVSNWPEPDKVRLLAPVRHQPWSHPPRHNGTAGWPRAGFGLPIVGRFQTRRRQGDPQGGRYVEPDDYRLTWKGSDGELRDRMASPLILKALALADGRYVPVALWLERDDPPGGRIVLCFGSTERAGSEVSFGAPLVAPGDRCDFPPIVGKPSLRRAFCDWLSERADPLRNQGRDRHLGTRMRRRGGPNQ